MNNGFISIHRKIFEWEWYQTPEMISVFLTLLLLANHQNNKWQGIEIKRGQLITGRKKISLLAGISEQTIRTCLSHLKSTNEITIKPTNKYSLITISNYDKYQLSPKQLTSKLTSKLTNNQPATNQQSTTNNNDNNDNKENKNNTNIIATSNEVANSINEVFKIFYEKINPTINFGNKTNRKACDDLIKRFGLEEIKKLSEFACAVQGQSYAPVITTPYQLKEKLSQLKIYFDQQNNKSKKQIYDTTKPIPYRS